MGGDQQLVAALRRGDETAFAGLVDRWGSAPLRLARAQVPTQASPPAASRRSSGRRVVFTWAGRPPVTPAPPGSSRVEIDRIPEGTGTRMRLTHTVGVPGFGEKVEAGWSHYATRLATAGGGGDSGPDPWVAG